MERDATYYRRNLPHLQPPGATFFITFRLAGSLPSEVILRLKEEEEQNEKHLLKIKDEKERKKRIADQRKRYFSRFDETLDNAVDGPHWLKDERVAKVVADAIHYRDGKEYDLIANCIMPNHVHMVLTPIETVGRRASSPYILTNILENLKWYTALKANRILRRKGAFWQHESYDHVVRNGKELERIIWYVMNNPVKAGLVTNAEDWKWGYYLKEL